MIEIEHLTKSIGLSTFRYWTYPLPRYDDIPVSQLMTVPEPAPDDDAPPSPQAAPAPAGPVPSTGVRGAAPIPPVAAPRMPAAPAAGVPALSPRAGAPPLRAPEPVMRRYATPSPAVSSQAVPAPRAQATRPAMVSVLGEVADALRPPAPAPGASQYGQPSDPNTPPPDRRSGRYSRAVRSAWRAATDSPPPPR